jgi:hypothetical protein
MIVNILIVFLVFLLFYQLFIYITSDKVIEGMDSTDTSSTSNPTYNDYDTKNPNNTLILCQQNAGNIQYLKGRVDELAGMKSDITTLQQQMTTTTITAAEQ